MSETEELWAVVRQYENGGKYFRTRWPNFYDGTEVRVTAKGLTAEESEAMCRLLNAELR